jgi:hypothetical protein
MTFGKREIAVKKLSKMKRWRKETKSDIREPLEAAGAALDKYSIEECLATFNQEQLDLTTMGILLEYCRRCREEYPERRDGQASPGRWAEGWLRMIQGFYKHSERPDGVLMLFSTLLSASDNEWLIRGYTAGGFPKGLVEQIDGAMADREAASGIAQ